MKALVMGLEVSGILAILVGIWLVWAPGLAIVGGLLLIGIAQILARKGKEPQ